MTATDSKRLLNDVLAALRAAGAGEAALIERAIDIRATERNDPRLRQIGEDAARRLGGRPVIDDAAALEAITKATVAGTPRSIALARAVQRFARQGERPDSIRRRLARKLDKTSNVRA